MGVRDLEKTLEWEPAAEPTTIEFIALPSPFIEGTKKVTITRDEEMRLHLVAEGLLMENGDLRARVGRENEVPAGTFLSASNIEFEAHGAQYDLRAFLSGVPDTSFSHEEPRQTRFRQNGTIIHVRRRWAQKFALDGDDEVPGFEPLGAPIQRTDWFINGPHDFLFTAATKRRAKSTFSREREFQSLQIRELPSGASSRDHFTVKVPGVHFAVCKVPDEHCPPWCYPTSIEFLDPIPDDAVREAVGEIVSFVIGRRMMPIGSTLFDVSGWPIEDAMTNPWGDGIRQACGTPDLPPVPLGQSGEVERVLADLVPKYLALRDELRLNDSLWTYWIAKEAPTGVDLALFSAAVESMKTSWFRSTKTTSKGEHMPKEDFEAIIKEVGVALRERLANHPAAQTILNRVAGAYRMGSGEQVRAFFDEIDLPIGRAEAGAMRARNGPAHGGVSSGANLNELVRHGHAYRTLFERTFLRMLGYEGMYVDRTTLGHPSRSLSAPVGG
jgi:hypothetical protein